jgi:hypothetical protein
MRRFGLGLLVAAAGAVVIASAMPAAAAPVTKCPKTKLTRVLAGKRTCVARTAVRPARTPPTRAGSVAALAFGRVAPLRFKNGTIAAPAISPALSGLALRTFTGAQKRLKPLVTALRGSATKELTRETADPVFTTTKNPDGSASGTISQTVDGPNGGRVDLSLGLGVKPGKGDEDASLSVDLGATATEADGASKTFALRIVSDVGASIPSCPTAAGKLPLKSRSSASVRNGETFGSKRVRLGAIREGVHVNFTSGAQAQMGPDARLQPFPFTVTVNMDYSRSATALALFGARQRAKGTVTISGTMDPVTGLISGGTLSSNATANGFNAPDAAAAAIFRAVIEKAAKEEAGRVRDWLHRAETAARNGECTKLTFVPGSPSPLAPGASKGVQAQIATKADNTPVRARWSAIAAKGGVAPKVPPQGATANLTVTGASTGPQTATINVKAVSAAGISQGTWVGTAGTLPPSYSGTVSFTQNLGTLTESWDGTFTWTKSGETANPDGSVSGVYALTAATVNTFSWSGSCTGSTSGPSGTIVAGDAEVDVSPAGQWSSAVQLDVKVAPFMAACPPAMPTLITTGKAFFNSRSPSGLRPMAPNGAIAATNVTDVGGGVVPTTASWNIVPGT